MILNNNKMIAIFMGGKIRDSKDMWLSIHGICRYDTIGLGRGKILEYHKSWDWLIPVIDKITSDDSYSEYVSYTSNMFGDGGVDINTTFINVTYDNVIDFITWYNKII